MKLQLPTAPLRPGPRPVFPGLKGQISAERPGRLIHLKGIFSDLHALKLLIKGQIPAVIQ